VAAGRRMANASRTISASDAPESSPREFSAISSALGRATQRYGVGSPVTFERRTVGAIHAKPRLDPSALPPLTSRPGRITSWEPSPMAVTK
jgi:hypothetical protein